MKSFVLEGPDFAGKSTMATCLIEYLENRGEKRVDLLHMKQPTDAEQRDLEEHYLRAVARVGALAGAVFDRLYVGELVYGPIYRSGSALAWEGRCSWISAHSITVITQPICLGGLVFEERYRPRFRRASTRRNEQ